MNKNRKMDLQLFSDYGTGDFFTSAFSEMYETPEEGYNDSGIDNTEPSSDAVEATESVSSETPDELHSEEEVTPTEAIEQGLSREELLEAIKATQSAPQLDEETQQALELMNYLKENPHLIQAMRGIDPVAHQELNSHVPDEFTQKMQAMEEFMIEQQYQSVVKEMESKYPDYDAEKVLEFAEQHELVDLDVAYKALKAESAPVVDKDNMRKELEKEIREQIMKEMKETISNTSSIISTGGDVPNVQSEVTYSHKEKKIAENFGLSIEDYVKWRDEK